MRRQCAAAFRTLLVGPALGLEAADVIPALREAEKFTIRKARETVANAIVKISPSVSPPPIGAG
jgi:hypothetical protein